MENASKALIIAGAILISIVLVSVGVIVVQALNPSDAVTTMSEQEIRAFNGKFESSTGRNKSGTIVKNLMSTIIVNNSSYSDDTSKQVKVVLDGITISGVTAGTEYTLSADLTNIKNGVGTATRYDIEPTFDTNSGLITKITIKTH